jgi:hypothetical protein
MRFMRAMAVAAIALSLSACIEFIGPWGISGRYDLYAANGASVPAVVYSRNGAHPFVITLTGGELRLRDDESFTLDLDYVENDGGAETRYTQGIAGQWSSENDTVWLDYVDPTTGERTSLGAFWHHSTLEVTIPGAVQGATVRVAFRN